MKKFGLIYFLLVTLAFSAYSLKAVADEKLGAKIQLRHGPLGPVRASEVFPGDVVCFSVDVNGLTPNSDKVLRAKYQYELRNSKNDLVKIVGSGTVEYKPTVGTSSMTLKDHFEIPVEYRAGDVKLRARIEDLNSDKEVTCEELISIEAPAGPYPIMVAFTLDENDTKAGSGKYVTGESVYLSFRVGGIEGHKVVHCTLDFVPKGNKELSGRQLTIDMNKLDSLRTGVIPNAKFYFTADEVFLGCLRLSIKDADNNTSYVEIPIEIGKSLQIAD